MKGSNRCRLGVLYVYLHTVYFNGDAAAAVWPLVVSEITEIGLAWSGSWQEPFVWHRKLPADDGNKDIIECKSPQREEEVDRQ